MRKMRKAKTAKAILTPDGKVLIAQLDGGYRKTAGKTDWERVNALTDAQIEDAAEADPDAPILK